MSSEMPKIWRVMLNKKKWNQQKYEKLYAEYPETRRLAQSKGACRMVVCPKKGDTVNFVYNGKIVMKGVVDSDGFEHGTHHQHHSCNSGIKRPHATPPECTWISISEVGLSIPIRHTGQRTWAKMPTE